MLTFPFYQELKSCYCPKTSILVTFSSCDMSPRSEVAWKEWEEKNLLPWLDAHRALPWKARGKPAPTHILHNIRWTEALSLCEGKGTIFCASNVALVPDRLSIQAIQATQAEQELIARPAIRLH